MHISKSISITVSLLLFISVNIHAQSSSSSLNYSLEFNRGSYDTMQQRVGERGISASDFGRWLANNGQVSVLRPGDDIGAKGTDAQLPQQHRLTLFLVDQNGSVQQSSYATFSYRGADGESVQLGKMVTNLPGLLERMFPGDSFFPRDSFFPGDTFFPDANFINSSRELQRIAMDIGRRVSTDDGIVALVLMVTPDADRFEQDVSPGGTAFAAKELDF